MNREIERKGLVPGTDGSSIELTRDYLRSLHSAVVERPSSLSQFYQKRTLLSMHDIEQVYLRTQQFFERLDTIHQSISIEVRTDSSETFRASSLSEFKTFDDSQREYVKSIDIEMNYLIRLEPTGKPGAFKIELNFRDVPLLFQLAPVEVPDDLSAGIRLHIEHPDYILARSLKLAIDEWVKKLDEQIRGPFFEVSEKVYRFARNFTAPFIGFFVAIGAYFYYEKQPDALSELFQAAAFFTSLYFLLRTGDRFLLINLSRIIMRYYVPTGFMITQGDKKRIEDRNRKNSRYRKLISFLFSSVIINILLGLFGSYLYDVLTQ